MTRRIVTTMIWAMALSAIPFRADAEVFTLWPSARGGADPAAALTGRDLWTEPVVVNGVRSALSIGLVRQDLRDCLGMLKRLYPEAHFRHGVNSIMMETRDGRGRRRRIFLVELGGQPYAVMRFQMELPATFPTPLPWPAGLPLPPDATPRQTLDFPERAASYGQFTTSLPPAQALADLAARLRADGWVATSLESSGGGLAGRGEIFLRMQPLAVMVLNLTETDDGGSRGTIYSRKLP